MKKLFALPLLVALALPSCATVQSARDKLAEMPETEYQSLIVKVHDGGEKAGNKLQELLADKPEVLEGIDAVSLHLMNTIENETLDTADVVQDIVDRIGDRVGLSPELQDYIKDGARAIDAAVGQIRVGIDGKLTEREKGLVLEFLHGLRTGLSA